MRALPLSILTFAAIVPAQGFTAIAETASPLTVTLTAPGHAPLVQTVPSGTPAGAVWLQPILGSPATGGATGLFDGIYSATETLLELRIAESGGATGQATMTVSPHDYVLVLQAPVPTPVEIRIDWSEQHSGGAALPLAQVDLGDDGIVDFTGFATGQALTVPLTVGPTPFRVRTRTAWTAAPGNVQTHLSCRVTPRFPVTTTTVSPGCVGSLNVVTTFDHELVLRGGVGATAFAVIGLTQTSLPLPLPLPLTSACVLGAAPDIVLAAPQGQLRIDLQTLPRPIVFHAQIVSLLPALPAIVATDTKRIVVH